MIIIMTNAQLRKKDLMNDEDEEDPQHPHQSLSLPLEDEDEVYFTHDGYDPLSPRFDIFDKSPPNSARESPKLVHTNTILRLCPEIESVTTTYAIGAAGSMKIASKLFHYISDARKTLSQSAIGQAAEKPIEETVSTTNLSSPSVMKWLRKVSYLVTAFSSMESTSNLPVQPQPQPPPHQFDSILCQITEKAKTPSDLKPIVEAPILPKKSRYHLEGDSPEPLIQLFTLNHLPKVHEQKLFTKVSSGRSVSRVKQRGPYIIKSSPNQYKIDPAEEPNSLPSDHETELAQELESKLLLKVRKNLPISSKKGTKTNRNKVENQKKSEGKVSGKKTSSKWSVESISDSIRSGEGELEEEGEGEGHDHGQGESDARKGNSRRHHRRRSRPGHDEEDSDPDLMFIHDLNPAHNEIDGFEDEFEFYSLSARRGARDQDEDPLTVAKLHSRSRSTDQQDLISVEIKTAAPYPSTAAPYSSSSTASSFISPQHSAIDLKANGSHGHQRPSTSPHDRQSALNHFAIVDTRHFSDDSQSTSSQRRLPFPLKNNSQSLASESSPLDQPNSTFSSSSLVQSPPVRPTTTGSIAMDQFYTKQYYDQLARSLLSTSIVASVQPNHLEPPNHRSHSAQQYRQLRSPPFLTHHTNSVSSSSPSASISTSLPSPVKPFLQSNQQTEKIFLNSARKQQQTSTTTARMGFSSALNSNQHQLPAGGGRRSKTSHQRQGKGSQTSTKKAAHYMEGTGHLRPETYDGVKRSLQIVTYYTENNYH
jgi:hypothetical protein